MPIQSINPSNTELINTFDEMSDEEVDIIIRNGEEAFQDWKKTPFNERSELFHALADYLETEKANLAATMATEMGKPISEGIAEVEKSAWACRYFADNAEKLLQDEKADVDTAEAYVTFDPLGVILAVMPWNFPIWQVIRFAAPALMAGNVGVLKHASNVPQLTLELEKAFVEVGFPDGVFQTLLISSSKVENAINHKCIKAISLTGGEIAGKDVASKAGSALKKCVLELGGSDPFIILEDADLDKAIEAAVTARTINSGQSCIAAKRFIVHDYLYEEFSTRLATQLEALLVGDPLNESTQVGPLATGNALKSIERQVSQSLEMGATLVTGGRRLNLGGNFYSPTVLTDVTRKMPVFQEETFGPVAAIIQFSTNDEAIEVANDSQYGLGASLWTQDTESAKQLANQLDVGAVFVNEIVRSDPRMPFGGIKKSGFGRELGSYGIKEFVNIKSVVIKK